MIYQLKSIRFGDFTQNPFTDKEKFDAYEEYYKKLCPYCIVRDNGLFVNIKYICELKAFPGFSNTLSKFIIDVKDETITILDV
jgi:hypothetical protein